VRRSRLDCLRGGIAGEGAARDRLPEAFVLRPLEATFPFSSVGGFLAADFFLGDFGIAEFYHHRSFPIRDIIGNVSSAPQ
jgi:hypothetical protein